MNDESLIQLYFDRSERAIVHTDEEYGPYCHSISYNILKSHEESEECVNETYLKVWNAIPPQRPSVFRCFIGRITRNLSINRYTILHAEKRGGGDIIEQLSELEECTDMNINIESEIERKEILEAISSFLTELKDIKKRVFMQRYWYVMDIKEIAINNQLGESKVKMMLLRMRKDLKDYLVKKELL